VAVGGGGGGGVVVGGVVVGGGAAVVGGGAVVSAASTVLARSDLVLTVLVSRGSSVSTTGSGSVRVGRAAPSETASSVVSSHGSTSSATWSGSGRGSSRRAEAEPLIEPTETTRTSDETSKRER